MAMEEPKKVEAELPAVPAVAPVPEPVKVEAPHAVVEEKSAPIAPPADKVDEPKALAITESNFSLPPSLPLTYWLTLFFVFNYLDCDLYLLSRENWYFVT